MTFCRVGWLLLLSIRKHSSVEITPPPEGIETETHGATMRGMKNSGPSYTLHSGDHRTGNLFKSESRTDLSLVVNNNKKLLPTS